MAQLRCAHICTATEGHAAPVTRDLECALADLDTPDDPGAITPTDPILAASVIGRSVFARKSVPLHIRELLTAESGCVNAPHATALTLSSSNDGSAYPFAVLSVQLLLRAKRSTIEVVGFWVLLGLLYQICLAILYGALFGWLAYRALRLANNRNWMDRESLVAYELVLSLVVDQTAAMAGLDDLLATFCAGAAFGWDGEFALAIEGSNWSQVRRL